MDSMKKFLPFVGVALACLLVSWLVFLKGPSSERSKLQAAIAAPLPKADGDLKITPDAETIQAVKLSIKSKGSKKDVEQLFNVAEKASGVTKEKLDVLAVKGNVTGSTIVNGSLDDITKYVAVLRQDIALIDNGQIRGKSPLVIIQKFQTVSEDGKTYKAVIDFSQVNDPDAVINNLPGSTEVPEGQDVPAVSVPDTRKKP